MCVWGGGDGGVTRIYDRENVGAKHAAVTVRTHDCALNHGHRCNKCCWRPKRRTCTQLNFLRLLSLGQFSAVAYSAGYSMLYLQQHQDSGTCICCARRVYTCDRTEGKRGIGCSKTYCLRAFATLMFM